MMMSQPQRYCSFRFDTSSIIGLHPLDTLIIGVSSHECKVYSKGGMRRYNITHATALASEDWPLSANSSTPEELKANEFKFTCSTLFKRTSNTLTSYDLQNQDTWQWPTHIVIGTSTPFAYCFDLNHDVENQAVMKYNTEVASTCVKENGNFIIFGCSDGKIRLYDGKIRNNKCLQSIEVHSGSVFDISVSLNGSLLISCGLSAKKINPYDPNSPTKYYKDPMIRVTDVRRMKQITSFSLASQTLPKSLRFQYEFSSCCASKMMHYDDDTLFVLSTNGVIQTIDARNSNDVSNTEMFFGLDEEDFNNNSAPAALTIAPSAEVVVIATNAGVLNQFCKNVDPNIPESSRKCINFDSYPTNVPPAMPVVERSFGVDEEVLAGQYTFNSSNANFPLLSSFHGTPQILHSKFKLTSRRKVSEEIKKDLIYHDYLGTAPNKQGFVCNSMIYGSNAKKAYAVCDPRKTEDIAGNQGEEGVNVHIFNIPQRYRLLKTPRGVSDKFTTLTSRYAG